MGVIEWFVSRLPSRLLFFFADDHLCFAHILSAAYLHALFYLDPQSIYCPSCKRSIFFEVECLTLRALPSDLIKL